MRVALNTITLGREVDPLAALRATADAGFDSVGVWFDALSSLQEREGSLESVMDLPLRPEEMCYLGGWMWATGEARDNALQAAEDRASLAAEIGCPVVIACASGGTGDAAQAAEDFRAIADIGEKYGVVETSWGAFIVRCDERTTTQTLDLAKYGDERRQEIAQELMQVFLKQPEVKDYRDALAY